MPYENRAPPLPTQYFRSAGHFLAGFSTWTPGCLWEEGEGPNRGSREREATSVNVR
jgi:hypothetical protein